MTESRPKTPSDAAARLRRRAKRGVVAGWIHDLSARHATPAPRAPEGEAVRPVEAPLEPQPGEAVA